MHSRPSWIRRTLIPGLAAGTVALGACGDSTGPDVCGNVVDLFPIPVASATSPFPSIDDDFIGVDFASGFKFTFYGTQYSTVYLNTNGGMTFGSGEGDYDVAATDVTVPGIAIFWGDLDAAGDPAAVNRANQMKYESCADRFVVTYTQMQDNDDDTWNNTATVTLAANGKITIVYGNVLSEDILVGVFNGTHTDDRYVAVQNNYAAYSTTGTGTILMDDWGSGPSNTTGALNGRTVTFNP